MRKGSFIILGVYFVISVVFLFLSNKADIYKSSGISMLFGLSWQSFTLTSLGSRFVGKINKIISI